MSRLCVVLLLASVAVGQEPRIIGDPHEITDFTIVDWWPAVTRHPEMPLPEPKLWPLTLLLGKASGAGGPCLPGSTLFCKIGPSFEPKPSDCQWADDKPRLPLTCELTSEHPVEWTCKVAHEAESRKK